jgi:hypothetical protein
VLLAATCLVACSGHQVRYEPRAALPPAPGAPVAVLYLVGDGGEVNSDREAVLAHLATDIEAAARGGAGPPVVVAFLGDNIYDEGAPAEQTEEDLEKLAGQVRAIGTAPNVHGVFVPGNHDWADGGSVSAGREAIARQRAWIDEMATDYDVRFLPDDGCPGPAAENLGEAARLVFIDTEWLLRSPEEGCGTAADFYARLTEELRAAGDRPVVVLSHHPLASGGPHGGNVGLFQRGPLVYFLASKTGALRQDLDSPSYSAMRDGIAEAIARSGAPPLVHAGGHDHTLQVIRLGGPHEPRYQIVSGALSKTERVRRIGGTRYASDGFGYVRLEFVGARVRLVVFRRDVEGGPVSAVFSCFLSQDASSTECPEATLAAGT